MSSATEEHPLAEYVSGNDRYIRFAEDILGLELAETQRQILRTVTKNKNSVVMSGNGTGKSFAIAILCLSWLYCNPQGSVLITSGSYAQLNSTVWAEMKTLLQQARDSGFPLPGRTKESPPRIEFAEHPSKAFRAISTTNPGALEGRHAKCQLVVVDEIDKDEIDAEVIESARSSVTDENDAFLTIGNPPSSEANVMMDLLTNDNYETINFSSFDSHNVRVEAGLIDGRMIPGLVGLSQLEEDYQLWNREEFPGVEKAMAQVEPDEDGILRPTESGLDERWVRRRLGAVPDDGTEAVRPFYMDDVANAEARWDGINPDYEPDYAAYGVDIARGGGDRTVVVGVTNSRADVLVDEESPGDHRINKQLIRRAVGNSDAPIIIDAVGEGSGIADELDSEYNITRFKGGARANDRSKYYNQRAEALGKLGTWLQDGAIETASELVSEMRSASRHIEYEEKSTRQDYSWDVTSKSDLKTSDKMGRSPDLLDALSLACWGLSAHQSSQNAGYGFYSY